MDKELKLTIELVPSTSWYANMRKVVPKGEWDKIRKKAYAESGHRCAICSAQGRLNCHEIWRYDDQLYVQKLIGFVALCGLCHHVKHIGLAAILARKGQLDYESVVQHFMRINGCDRETFKWHRGEAFRRWRERSRHQWHVDLGEYEEHRTTK